MNNENIVKTFLENKLSESEKMVESFIEKNNRLEILKNRALKAIANAQIANDNLVREKN